MQSSKTKRKNSKWLTYHTTLYLSNFRVIGLTCLLLIMIKVTENFQSCLYEMSLIYLDEK